MTLQNEYLGNSTKILGNNGENLGNKISISDLIDNLHVKKDVKNNLKNLYYCFEDKIFGNIDIQKQLKVNKNTATSYIKFLKNNNIIEPVADYGKGKYKFK